MSKIRIYYNQNNTKGGGFSTLDPALIQVCESCYLTTCVEDCRGLRQYCPLVAMKRYKLEAEQVTKISQSTPLNRRWLFLERMANGDVEANPAERIYSLPTAGPQKIYWQRVSLR